MTSLEKAILTTLCYADVFDYPLKERELWKYLIKTKTTLEKFRAALASITKSKQVKEQDAFYV